MILQRRLNFLLLPNQKAILKIGKPITLNLGEVDDVSSSYLTYLLNVPPIYVSVLNIWTSKMK